jgi:hypothetical protein
VEPINAPIKSSLPAMPIPGNGAARGQFEHRMSDPTPNPELLRSLGQLVRGLSALFWGLPITLLACVHTAVQSPETEMLRNLGVIPPVLTTVWVAVGLWQLRSFQRQERIWMRALDRARMFSLVLVGLSPFLFWWNRLPGEPFFAAGIALMALGGLVFLSSLNVVLQRLAAMLPDESLRQETRYFATLNRYLLVGVMALGIALYALWRFPEPLGDLLSFLPARLSSPSELFRIIGPAGFWLMLFLTLLPLAMTMALLWKTKETIFESLFTTPR